MINRLKLKIYKYRAPLIYLIFIFTLAIPLSKDAQAQITYTPQTPDLAGSSITFSNETKPLGEFIKKVYAYGVGITAILATVVLMIGGFQWIIAGGSGEKIGEAKAWITASLSGLVLALSSYMILNLINPDLVNFSVRSIKLIERIEEYSAMPLSSGGLGKSVMSTNVSEYDAILKKEAGKIAVPCHVLKALMMKESTGNPRAIGPDLPKKPAIDKNAIGLMQLLPSTANLSREELLDPVKNIKAGAKFFSSLMAKPCDNSRKIVSETKYNTVCNGSDINFAIAAYNAGSSRNKESTICPGMTEWQCPKNKGFQQTRDYVNIVNANILKIKTTPGWNCD